MAPSRSWGRRPGEGPGQPPRPHRTARARRLLGAAALAAAAVVRIQLSSFWSTSFLGFRQSERRPWYSADGEEIGEEFEGGKGETPAYEIVAIEMPFLPHGRVGVNILKGRRQVTRVLHADAFNAGFRVGDDVVEVNGQPVETNEDVRRAVRKAVGAFGKKGQPLRFVVRRWAARGTTRGMVRMSSPKGMDHLVPMLDLTRGLLQDYPVVLFMEGSLQEPAQLSSRRAVELLDGVGVAFKAVDCTDEQVNPGLRGVVEELSGSSALPQLFAGGQPLGDRWLHDTSELLTSLQAAGASFLSTPVLA